MKITELDVTVFEIHPLWKISTLISLPSHRIFFFTDSLHLNVFLFIFTVPPSKGKRLEKRKCIVHIFFCEESAMKGEDGKYSFTGWCGSGKKLFGGWESEKKSDYEVKQKRKPRKTGWVCISGNLSPENGRKKINSRV